MLCCFSICGMHACLSDGFNMLQHAVLLMLSKLLLAGHQLHYDSDDEGQDGIRHPVMTSVLYLSSGTFNQQQQQYPKNQQGAETDDSNSTAAADVQLAQQQVYVGGPTLVTDQVLGGPMATKGWLVYPAVNRFAMLGGKYLHGECCISASIIAVL
eukprot:GHRR01037022.1.p1 GENE.GHRR01037022.1~~GHRR01037022.1.p1  ORF type:complete len:155 (+),score=53.11 GHRR01037022.1:306-770(+)